MTMIVCSQKLIHSHTWDNRGDRDQTVHIPSSVFCI